MQRELLPAAVVGSRQPGCLTANGSEAPSCVCGVSIQVRCGGGGALPALSVTAKVLHRQCHVTAGCWDGG